MLLVRFGLQFKCLTEKSVNLCLFTLEETSKLWLSNKIVAKRGVYYREYNLFAKIFISIKPYKYFVLIYNYLKFKRYVKYLKLKRINQFCEMY